jgi:hypothetical protein
MAMPSHVANQVTLDITNNTMHPYKIAVVKGIISRFENKKQFGNW